MTRIVGSTNNSEYFRIVGDASHATPGEPVTGLLFSDFETGGSASYLRQGSARVDLTLITLASASAAHADGGFIEVDATNMPGVYRCDFPDAAYLSGVQQVIFSLVAANANNAISIPITHDLIAFDLQSASVTLPAIPANWINAAGIAASAMDGKGNWNIGKAGYALTQAFPANFSDLAIQATSGKTSVLVCDTVSDGAKSSTALSSANWTAARAGYLDNINGHVPQTADHTANISEILTDTGTTLNTHLTDIKGASFDATTDSNEALRNRGDSAWITGAGGTPPDLLQSTTIDTLASQTSFTLVSGSPDDSAYADQIIIITDSATSEQKAVSGISAYSGATRTITLSSDPAIFGMSPGDTINIIAATGASGGGGGASAADVWSYNNRALTDKAGFAISGIKQTLDDLNDTPAASIVTNGAITTLSGSVVNVDTVDVTTANVDMRGTDNAATAASLSAAQNDLDILTGADGVTLASLQGNYAPNVVVPDPAGTAPTAVEIRAEIDANSTNLDSIIATLGVAGAGLTDLGGMSTGMQTEVLAEMNKIFSTQMAEAYAADGTVPTLEQCLMLIQQSIMEFAINGSLITIKQLDGVTTAAVVTMDSGTAPVTSRSRTS